MAFEGSLRGCRLALIEDDAVMGESLLVRLSLEGADMRWWTSGAEASRSLPAFGPEVVICDIRLPDDGGEALFDRLARHTPAPFLFMTAYSDIEQAVRLMRAGAADYVTKPFEFGDFRARLERLLLPGAGALGPSAAMRRIEAQLLRLAARPAVPVLLTGETGVGKQVCARFLHDTAPSPGPFVVVDCAALGEAGDRVEVALFGEDGLIAAAADGGTLFLDEVAELPDRLQPRFLRLIDERRFVPVGGSGPRSFEGRIVCATHADLRTLAKQGRFREDLLFRVDAAGLTVPPLRDRQEDILWLMHLILRRIATETGRLTPSVTTGAELLALGHDWPGNVRELRNRVERAAALTEAAIGAADLFPDKSEAAEGFALLAETRDMAERRHIRLALARTTGNVPEAAALLGISRSTLFEKMRRLGLARDGG
jgi:DNA-binding NtrC family response regulator